MSYRPFDPAAAQSEPSILTANTYFWRPGSTADQRRRSEQRHCDAVSEWFAALGMELPATAGPVVGIIGAIRAEFSYWETCGNVYRRLSVTVAGKPSNITTLRRLADPATRAGMLSRATRREKRDTTAAVTAKLTRRP